MIDANRFPPEFFQRQDDGDDRLFYLMPRPVVHIDEPAIAALGTLFGDVLPPGGDYLDLMSSWRTHLPAALQPQHVTGLGMNEAEMADNPQLTEIVVHNLNADPQLPFDDEAFDAVICTVSVQYLTQPFAVFAEVNRVLKTGGVFVVSFSNRCFPSKAIAGWLYANDQQHIAIVASYFVMSGGWGQVHTRLKVTADSDPLFMLWAEKVAA
jgi:SAM-dependent methyltransferase